MPFDGDPRAAYALVHDDGTIEHRRVAYDHEASAAKVREHGTAWAEIIAKRIEQRPRGRRVSAAFGWGALAASSLVLGALLGLARKWPDVAVGLVLAFGAGALISAVSFDLAEEGVEAGGGGRGRRSGSRSAR